VYGKFHASKEKTTNSFNMRGYEKETTCGGAFAKDCPVRVSKDWKAVLFYGFLFMVAAEGVISTNLINLPLAFGNGHSCTNKCAVLTSVQLEALSVIEN
jgi:hypothetical protein